MLYLILKLLSEVIMKSFFLFLSLVLCATVYGNQGFDSFQITISDASINQPLEVAPGRNTDYLIIESQETNTATVYVGGANVTTTGTTIGISLDPGEKYEISSALRRGTSENLNTSNIYVVATASSVPLTIGVTNGRRP